MGVEKKTRANVQKMGKTADHERGPKVFFDGEKDTNVESGLRWHEDGGKINAVKQYEAHRFYKTQLESVRPHFYHSLLEPHHCSHTLLTAGLELPQASSTSLPWQWPCPLLRKLFLGCCKFPSGLCSNVAFSVMSAWTPPSKAATFHLLFSLLSFYLQHLSSKSCLLTVYIW